MVLKLSAQQSGFKADFAAFLTTKREVSTDVIADVEKIIAHVVENGMEACGRCV